MHMTYTHMEYMHMHTVVHEGEYAYMVARAMAVGLEGWYDGHGAPIAMRMQCSFLVADKK